MGVITYEMEVSSPIPPARMFRAFVLESDTLIPKIMPQAIKSVDVVEGNGGPGTIKLITFGEGSQYKIAKQRVDGIDKDNFTYCYTMVEGDALAGVLESISYEIKISASSNGGSTCKNISKYHTKDEAQITEEQIKGGKEKAMQMFKAIEAYLLENPEACN